VTRGEASGTDGRERQGFLIGAAVSAAIILGVTVVNVLTIQHDEPDLDWWEPWLWEGSSAVVVISLMWLPWLALRLAPAELWRSPRTWFTHALAILVWSAAHVTGFLIIRHAVYGLAGQTYAYGALGEEFPYELRKDVLSYTLTACAFWVSGRLALQSSATTPDQPATFDIRDGAKVIRVSITDILAVASAGNYVEVHLVDGRKPLMRSSLAAVEGQLSPFGFVRTHRSWLVSAARVTGLTPAGSGDYTVTVGPLEAPLSRRFPGALQRCGGGWQRPSPGGSGLASEAGG